MEKEEIHAARAHFGQLFKDLRRAKGLTQTEVADFCGVTFQTINKVEHGALPYSVDLFFKLSVILDFTVELTPKENDSAPRFLLQEGTRANTYVITDQKNEIVCTFEEHRFNETANFKMLNDNIIPINKLATIIREFGEWLHNNADGIY